MDYQFQNKSKFALLTFKNVYTDLPATAFLLSDGTWVMPDVPVPDLGIWKEWLGLHPNGGPQSSQSCSLCRRTVGQS